MPQFTGTISKGGDVIWEGVEGIIAHHGGAVESWSGTFLVTGARKEPLQAGGTYRLDAPIGWTPTTGSRST
jgi:hypothetical protein